MVSLEKFRVITAISFVQAHELLGREVKDSIWKALNKKLEPLKADGFLEEIKFVRSCRSRAEQILFSDKVASEIKNSLQEYFICLSAWTKGAELENFHHRLLDGLAVDGATVLIDDLAFWLQNDNLGCQTGMRRERDGSIIFWHMEEDRSRFVEEPLIYKFKIQDQEVTTFIYPHLLPGSTFSWRPRLWQAADSLHIKYLGGGILANIACWIAWYQGERTNMREIAESLTPFVDGYAFNTVKYGGENKIYGEKLEFGVTENLTSFLPNREYSWLFQVNLVSDPRSKLALAHEMVGRRVKKLLRKRWRRTDWFLRFCKFFKIKITPAKFLTLISSRWGGDYAYANYSVLAYAVGRMSGEKMDLWMGFGPPVKYSPIIHLEISHH